MDNERGQRDAQWEERQKARRRLYHQRRTVSKSLVERGSSLVVDRMTDYALSASLRRALSELVDGLSGDVRPELLALALDAERCYDEIYERGVQLSLFD